MQRSLALIRRIGYFLEREGEQKLYFSWRQKGQTASLICALKKWRRLNAEKRVLMPCKMDVAFNDQAGNKLACV